MIPSAHSRPRLVLQAIIDIGAWSIAILTAQFLVFDFNITARELSSLAVLALIAALAQAIFGWVGFLYRGRYWYGSFEEVRSLSQAVVVTAGVLLAVAMVFDRQLGVPIQVVLLALPIALLLMLSVRYVRRGLAEAKRRHTGKGEPTLIYGAGELGSLLTRRMLIESSGEYWPVGLVDDNASRRHLQLQRVRVLGTFDELEEVVSATNATVLVVAFAEADAELLRRVQHRADDLGLQVKVMPNLAQTLDRDTMRPSDLRDLSIEDLLGRAPTDTGVELVAGYLSGKRVLVTGAGGSIGSELCAQIARFEPAELIMLDRDETGLQHTQLTVRGNGLLDTDEVVLADIRDAEAVRNIFLARLPEVVFHAAALKHLPMLEHYPDEGWKTNVQGTVNVLEAASESGVETLINISTDKAANPTSVLGYSKRLAEKLTAWYGLQNRRRYVSVRFGNVIGSRGSMLPTFTTLIEQGGPVTVTHPEATRYFMTIPEACQLVMQAGSIGTAGEVLILDMGEPVNILTVAQRMIAWSGKDIEVVFTGLREGEKLHEELVEEREAVQSLFHPKIAHTNAVAMTPAALDYGDWCVLTGRDRPGAEAVAPIKTGTAR